MGTVDHFFDTSVNDKVEKTFSLLVPYPCGAENALHRRYPFVNPAHANRV